jgi:ribonuclease VapC
MIVDTSALIAILRAEPDAVQFARAIASADHCSISAANFLEAAMVVDSSRDPVATRRLDDALSTNHIAIEPVTERQARLARDAFRDFGRGSGHPAKLNFGDCFAYALARDKGEALLFKGGDFATTDIEVALLL